MEESPKEGRVKNNENHETVAENKRVKFQEGRGARERFGETKD